MVFPAFLLGLSLAADAMAAAAIRGVAARALRLRDVVVVALLFGAAQALMPWLGWRLGVTAGPFIEAWDHWVAFALLAIIGGKMILEARKPAEEAEAPQSDSFAWRVLLMLALATSIDAFAAGIALPSLGVPPLLTIAVIGTTTALLSGLGVVVGHRFGAAIGPKLELVGGVVLIALGVRVLVEHLSA